jgi:hypothetical protein
MEVASKGLAPPDPQSDASRGKNRRGHKTGLRCSPASVIGYTIEAPRLSLKAEIRSSSDSCFGMVNVVFEDYAIGRRYFLGPL